MINIIIKKLITNKSDFTDEYLDSLYRQVENFIEYTTLPLRYLTMRIDPNNYSPKLNHLGDQILDIIYNSKSCLGWVDDFKDSGYIAGEFIEKYLSTVLLTDDHPKSILYIDTNLLLQDYRKLISESYQEMSPKIIYSKEILYRNIQEADFVIWDKFNLAETTFDINKLYEILSIRYRNCLGNLFFCKGSNEKELFSSIDLELRNVMDVQRCLCDLRGERYSIVNWEDSND